MHTDAATMGRATRKGRRDDIKLNKLLNLGLDSDSSTGHWPPNKTFKWNHATHFGPMAEIMHGQTMRLKNGALLQLD